MQVDINKLNFEKALNNAHNELMKDFKVGEFSVKTKSPSANEMYNEIVNEVMSRYSEQLSKELFIELFRQSTIN